MTDVTEYSITLQSLTCGSSPSTSTRTTTTYWITMLLPGQTYRISVQAKNMLSSSTNSTKHFTTSTEGTNY